MAVINGSHKPGVGRCSNVSLLSNMQRRRGYVDNKTRGFLSFLSSVWKQRSQQWHAVSKVSHWNTNKTDCIPLPMVETLTSPQLYVHLTLCLAFLLVLSGALALYVRFWNMRVVRASDRILMILFLIEIIVCLLLETLVLIFGEGPFCK